MSDHGIGNLVPIVIWGLFIFAGIRRFAKRRAPAVALPGQPAVNPEQSLARRRLAAPAMPRPPRPAAAVAAIAPAAAADVIGDAGAAAAFPVLDLSLPGAGGSGPSRPRKRLRSLGGGPPVGSPAWAVNAIVANEILGPPVSLRAGATLGTPHAF